MVVGRPRHCEEAAEPFHPILDLAIPAKRLIQHAYTMQTFLLYGVGWWVTGSVPARALVSAAQSPKAHAPGG